MTAIPAPGGADDAAAGTNDGRSGHRALAITLAFYLLVSAAFVGYRGVAGLNRYLGADTDFNVFYSAGEVIVGPERAYLYDPAHWTNTRRTPPRAVGAFFNPPLFALLYAPFTLLGFDAARLANLGLSLLAATALLAFARRWGAGGWRLGAIALAVVSFFPLWLSFWTGQPSAYFAIVAATGLVAAEAVAATQRDAILGLLALKPPLFVGPLLLLVQRRRFTTAGIAAIAGALLFLAPFVSVGVEGIRQYLSLSSEVSRDGFVCCYGRSAGAVFMFTWNGLLAGVFRTDVPLIPALLLDGLTLLVLARVWLTASFRDAWLATAVTTALVTPHYIPYDLLLVLPAAVAAVLQRPTPAFVAALAGIHLALNVSVLDSAHLHESSFLRLGATWAPLALLALLLFLAFRERIEAAVDATLALPPRRRSRRLGAVCAVAGGVILVVLLMVSAVAVWGSDAAVLATSAPAFTSNGATVTSPPASGVRHFVMSPGSRATYVERVRVRLLVRDVRFAGSTNAVGGELYLTAAGELASGEASGYHVILDSLQSDQPLRDRFLTNEVLQTRLYPTADFRLESIEGAPASYDQGKEVALVLHGTLTIHGASRPATWSARVRLTGDALSAVADTDLRLADYGLSLPTSIIEAPSPTLHLQVVILARQAP